MGLLDKINKKNIFTGSAFQDMICNTLHLEECYIEGNVLYIRSDKTVTFYTDDIKILYENKTFSKYIEKIWVGAPVDIFVDSDFSFNSNIQIQTDHNLFIGTGSIPHFYNVENINVSCDVFIGSLDVNILSGEIECKRITLHRGCVEDKIKVKLI